MAPDVPKAKASNTVLPLVLAAVFGILLLAHAGVIDLPKVGQKVKYLLEPPDDDSVDDEPMKLTDGKVNSPYSDTTLGQIPGQLKKQGVCLTGCRFFVQNEDMLFPPGLKFNSDLSITGTPTRADTFTFSLCYKDADDFDCFSPEFSITIKPEDKPVIPCDKPCPTEPNPPCHTQPEGDGEFSPSVSGVLTYECCTCPIGTHPDPSGTIDRITPGGPYKMCLCN